MNTVKPGGFFFTSKGSSLAMKHKMKRRTDYLHVPFYHLHGLLSFAMQPFPGWD